MKSVDSPNYRITNSLEDPTNINLDSYPLFKERIFGSAGTSDNGRIKEINHYKTFDGNSYSDLAVKEVYTYTDQDDFLAIKQLDVTFYKDDNSAGITQTKFKYYNGPSGTLESIEEGEVRRKYLIKVGKLYLLSAIGIPAGITLFTELKDHIQQYEGVNNQTGLFNAINASLALTQEQKTTLIYLLMY